MSRCSDPVELLTSLSLSSWPLAVIELSLLLFPCRTVGGPYLLRLMKMAAFHWMGTYYVWNVTLFVLKQRAEEFGVSVPSRPLHSVLFPSPPLSCPSAWQGRLLPVKTLPAQLVTHVGFATCRLHYEHPLRKDLFSHRHFLAVLYSRLRTVTEMSAKSLFPQDKKKDQISTIAWWK